MSWPLVQIFFPEPKFRIGQLLFIPHDAVAYNRNRYLSVERRRWVKPNGRAQRTWVYDGPIFEVSQGDKLVFATTGTCFLEETLRSLVEQ